MRLGNAAAWALASLLAGCGGSVCIEGVPCGGAARSYAETQPAPVSGSPRASALGLGNWHSCWLDAAGAAWCAGSNERGQLGATSSATCMDGNVACSAEPLAVEGGRRFTAIAGGHTHSCALDTTGAAWCWGQGGGGQLGDGQRSDSVVPVPVSGGQAFVQLAVSLWSGVSCGITAAGEAWCWGLGFPGSAGPATSAEPQRWASASGLRIRELALGEAHACARDDTDALWCWGRNSFGELGNGQTLSSPVPSAVGAGRRYTQVVVGPWHGCALDSAGQAWCWGFAAAGDGQPGDVARRTPVPVSGGHVFTQLAAGGQRSCGVAADGRAWCWGVNGQGGLGDGTVTDRWVPTAVAGAQRWQRVAAGGMASCGIALDGTLHCWGWNETGALGRPIEAH